MEKDDIQKVKQEPKESTCWILQYLNLCQTYNIISIAIAVVSVFVLVVIAVDECRICFKSLGDTDRIKSNKIEDIYVGRKLKKYWVYGRNVETGYLHNVFAILDRLGYENNPNATDWDLLWAHDYPFTKLHSKLKNLAAHQKVNHFPGSGYITNKVDLATSEIKYIPPAFKLPDDKERLLKYISSKPFSKFVQKNNDHRHIKLKNISEINWEETKGTFIQEFIEPPLLINGYKFDIGIYTIITSVDPLRVYIYNGDALLRFCPVKYFPFDPENIDKYVVGDDYLPTWQVPDLNYYYNTLGFGMKESLNAFLRAQGKKPSSIWEQIEESIRAVLLNKEPKIIEVAKRFKSKRNFFEMMRFDFVVDDNLQVYLMEANMSPNLSSAHFPPNQLLFEQVIYNLLSVVGVAVRTGKDTLARTAAEMNMESAHKNIAVYPNECNSELCRSSCLSKTCVLCKNCITYEDELDLLQAHNEFLNRGDCKRIFPPHMDRTSTLPSEFDKYSERNQMMYRWFLGKCILDQAWCK